MTPLWLALGQLTRRRCHDAQLEVPTPSVGSGRPTRLTNSSLNYHMTLLIPKHPSSTIPVGYTHPTSRQCPFQKGNFPSCPSGRCCCFRSSKAATILLEANMDDLCRRLYQNMSSERALDFARRLRMFVSAFRQGYRANRYGVAARSRNGGTRRNRRVYSRDFEKTVASVEEAARWYRKIGRMGCGVLAQDTDSLSEG
jgi:hypothetical protein